MKTAKTIKVPAKVTKPTTKTVVKIICDVEDLERRTKAKSLKEKIYDTTSKV